MDAWLLTSALALTAASGLAFYAGSPHCLWRRLRGAPRLARGVGTVLAAAALASWIAAYGIVAGVAAMLVAEMLALAAQPWIALLAAASPGDPSAAGIDAGRRPAPAPESALRAGPG